MAVASHKSKAIENSLQNLSLSSDGRKGSKSTSKSQPSTKSPRPAPPPDSWEDDDDDDESEDSEDSPRTPNRNSNTTNDPTGNTSSSSIPSAPPPTPMSPTHRRGKSTDWAAFPNNLSTTSNSERATRLPASSGRDREREQRPEKTAATASRMIAGALGVKAPRMGEEARAYERSVRDKERRRVQREKEEREKEGREREEAKRRVWDG